MLEGDSSQVIQSVLRFEADLGIGSICTNHEKCMCMPLLKDQIVLATPNTEEYRSLNGVFPLDKLKKETFVIRESGSGTKIAYAGRIFRSGPEKCRRRNGNCICK